MELQCPNCKSTNLKKVSLAYQEGLQRVSTRTRLRGVVVGSDGPDVVVGRATTKGTQQTEISKVLTPPKKWSYVKLFGRSVLVFLSVGWIVFYVHTVRGNSSSVLSLPLDLRHSRHWNFCWGLHPLLEDTITPPTHDNLYSGSSRSFVSVAEL